MNDSGGLGRAEDEVRPVDLRSLSAWSSDETLARLRLRIQRAAGPELTRRRTALGVRGQLVRWKTPILAASGMAIAASMLILLQSDPESAHRGVTLEEALGVPSDALPWVGDKP